MTLFEMTYVFISRTTYSNSIFFVTFFLNAHSVTVVYVEKQGELKIKRKMLKICAL